MSREENRTADQFGHARNRSADLAYDFSYPNFRAKRVRRHCDGVAAVHCASCEVRPEALVQRLPISSMDEDHEAVGRTFRKEKVQAVASVSAVGNIEFRSAACRQFFAELLCGLDPCGGPAIATGYVWPIRIGVVPIRDTVRKHEAWPGFGLVLRAPQFTRSVN